jgi:hypothetical protein
LLGYSSLERRRNGRISRRFGVNSKRDATAAKFSSF